MNKITLGILLSVLVALSAACSNFDESVKPSKASTHKEEQNTASAGQSSTDSDENGDEVVQPSPKEDDEPAAGRLDEDKNAAVETSDPESSETGLDPGDYLNNHYPIEQAHYTTKTWVNDDNGSTELTVSILPDTKEFGEEIDDVFKNGSPFLDDKRTITMKDIAEDIMMELPDAYEGIHVDSVNWVSYDGEFAVTLVQDYR
ncbi:hypothetical protein [Bacillus sp. Marseille-Q1617]|uniref:hypothetical protein n=1 Tax=Bacillus sp. Marseille-Q1617 TaxID=2736887 RepID=UPI00158D4C0D|nr:hypothetical protein [Bacillus sp. Marseille-Q1617]